MEWDTKVKPEINSVEVHPQLSHKAYPGDGVLVDASSLWPGTHWIRRLV
jgi:hypothetical protein